MSRVIASLVLAVAMVGGPRAVAVMPACARLRVPAALVDGSGLGTLRPFLGASRDRALHGKARIKARRSA